ncbi:S14-like protein 2 [Clonorchis sinensis]|uniref:S14-like protein 2 n=1 Tax=Clonorchis sinensis TaxID=79923 RepID=A0A419PRZ8_CLOSI|nr:S14-like protein 2 [Clonorchis sinensis]
MLESREALYSCFILVGNHQQCASHETPERVRINHTYDSEDYCWFVTGLPSLAGLGQVLDSNYPETLLRHCDAESLPAVYGGTLIDPDGDPRCPSKICWAGPVPDSYINQSKQPHAPPPGIRVALFYRLFIEYNIFIRG